MIILFETPFTLSSYYHSWRIAKWIVVSHSGMSKDERKEACLVVVEQYEASLIDLMTTTALFGRVDIVIDDDVGIGENKHNTPALASRQHVDTHANTYTHIFLLYTSRFVCK